jgi:uncharacterized protein (TIGR04255 family)
MKVKALAMRFPMENNREKKELINNPHYPNPSIAEALCEIHFTTKTENTKDSIKELKKVFKNSYQPPQEKTIKQYHATIKEIGVSVEETSVPCWVFKHNERNHLVQVFPHMLSVNELERYPGWKTFSDDLSFVWNSARKAFSISSIKHVGLRYINLIPRKNADEPLSQWLKPNKYYPDGILDSVTAFVSRSEFSIEESKRLIVTIAEAAQKNHDKGFIFDIDTVFQINESMEWKSICEKITSLHDLISDVFFSSTTRKYESFLKGENL